MTSSRQPINRMVAQTVQALLQGIGNPERPAQHVKLDGALIQRGSTAPVREWTMRGFDSKWRDVPDFVIGITRQIWEDRDIGSLHTHYDNGLIVRSPASVLRDNCRVIGATIATLAEFPDRALLGEDLIWCDDPEGATDTSDANLSSHRFCCTATHCHPRLYGAPTGRCLAYRILADCAIRDDTVYDEWLVRNQLDPRVDRP